MNFCRFRIVPFLSICLLLGTVPVSAADVSPFGTRADTVNLDDAYRLPGIYADKLKVMQEGQWVRGSFSMENDENDMLGGMQFHIEIWGKDADEGRLYERTAIREPIVLQPKERRVLTFEHKVRDLPAGTYMLRVQVVTDHGRTLGWDDEDVTFASKPTSFVKMTNELVGLPEFDGKTFEPLSGPNVSAKGNIVLVSTIKNTTDKPVTFLPSLHVFTFDMARGDAQAQTFPSVTLKAGEERELTLPLTVSDKPEVYAGIVELLDPETQAPLSNMTEYRWVIRGKDADVFPLRMKQQGQKGGQVTIAQVDFVGAPDAETYTKGTVTIQLIDSLGVVTETTTPEVDLSDRIQSGQVQLLHSRDLAGNPRIVVTVKDKDGTVLDTHSEILPAQKPVTPTLLGLSTLGWAGLGGAILALACAASFFSWKTKQQLASFQSA